MKMRKWLRGVGVILLVGLLLPPSLVGGDGSLNALDITYIERCISGDTNYPETGGADSNEDGNYNALDITKVEILVGEA